MTVSMDKMNEFNSIINFSDFNATRQLFAGSGSISVISWFLWLNIFLTEKSEGTEQKCGAVKAEGNNIWEKV